jgi:Tol biopolymer transport system component
MDDGVITPLSGTERGGSPYFSPDGRWLAFHIGVRVFKVPVTGGAPVPVGDSVFTGGSWSEDGWVYNTSQEYSLRRRPAGGGSVTIVAPRLTGEGRGPWHAAALPGGAGVLFRRCASTGSESCRLGAWREDRGVVDLNVAGLAGWYLPTGHLFYVRADGAGLVAPFDLKSLAVRGDAVPVLENISLTPDDAPNLAWSPSGLLAYVQGNQVESGAIVHLGENGPRGRIAEQTGYFRNPIVSPDGSVVALNVFPPGQGRIAQLWLLDRRSGTLRPLITDRMVAAAAWSPDGSELVALGYRTGVGPRDFELLRVRVDGRDSVRRVPVSDPLAGVGLDWTPDGQWLVTTILAGARRELVAVPVAGTGAPRKLVQTPGEARWGTVSPDGRWLAYLSNESGGDVVYVRSLWEPGRLVAVGGGRPSPPQWRRDGRALYFAEADTVRMVELGFTPGPAVTGRRTLSGLTAAMGGLCPCYGPDRTVGDFVVVQRTVPTAALTVVVNWFSDIRRRIAQAGQ